MFMKNAVSEKRDSTPENKIAIIAALILVVGFFITMALTAPRNNFESITIEDSTGQLDKTLIKKELQGIPAYKNVDVFVYSKNGKPSDNINADTFHYMMKNHPEMIEGDKWADGKLILTLNIESGDSAFGSGQVGTYFGEDVKIKFTEQQKVQSEGYDLFHQRNWSQGIVDIAIASSQKMAKPFFASFIVQIVIFGILLLILLLWVMGIKKSRKIIKQSSETLKNNEENIDNYVSKAVSVLTGSYFEQIRKDASQIMNKHAELVNEHKDIVEIRWSMLGVKQLRINKFNQSVEELSNSVTVIMDSLVIYNRMPGWEESWAKNTSDVRTAIRDLIIERMGTSSELAKLGRNLDEKMKQIDRNMYSGKVDVNILFDEVNQINQTISEVVKEYMNVSLKNMDSSKASYIRSSIDERARNNRFAASSIFGYYALYSIYTPHIYNTGYSSGSQAYQSSQQSSSDSSNSTTGYGGSSGGFSGSGSSSSF